MWSELDAMATTPEHQAYLKEIRRRHRRATSGMRARYVSIHLSWIVVLLAGAAVSLVEVLDVSNWVTASLGFVVVVFQGFGRVFDRTAQGSRAMDVMRRGLAHEQRLVLVGGGPYAGAAAPLDLFAERCEQLLAENDRTMVDYFATLADEPGE